MSNFIFIKKDFPQLYDDAVEAERFLFDSPRGTAIFCRSTLENGINWLYEHDQKLIRPYQSDLSTLMHEHCFTSLIPTNLLTELNVIRKTGNQSAHGKRVKESDALASLKYLYRFMSHLVLLYGKETPNLQLFNEALIPRPLEKQVAKLPSNQADAKRIKKLQENIDYKNKKAREAEQQIAEQAKTNKTLMAQLKQAQAETTALKKQREQGVDIATAIPLEVSEAETRKRYIDLSLKECGWDHLREGYELEYPVKGMPASTNPSGKG